MATLLEVRDRIRQRTGNEHDDDFVTNLELNGLINLKYKELYGLLARHGLLRAETPFPITANGATSYALPVDHWGTLAVFREDGMAPVYLTRHDHRTRTTSTRKGPASTYRVVGFYIEFDPRPDTGSYTVIYVPVPPTLVDDADELDGVLGWEEYVVVAAGISVLVKDKLDTTDFRFELAQLEQRIIDEAKAAEFSENPTVQNVRLPRVALPGGDRGVTGYWGSPTWLFRGWGW
jgi:hypothetical protein